MKKRLLPWLVLVPLAAVLYGRSLSFDFAYDDALAVAANPAVTSDRLTAPFEAPYRPGTLYRPVTVLSYQLTYRLFGMEPWAFHLVNLILHAACALLVYLMVLPFMLRPGAALLTAALFTVHPVLLEAVANVVGRAELLAGLFGLSALLLLRAAAARPLAPRMVLFVLSAVSLLLAILSKESALSVLILAPAYCLWLDGASRKSMSKLLPGVLLLGLAAGGALFARYRVLDASFLVQAAPETFAAANPLLNVGFWQRLYPALQILGRYIFLLVFPLHLSADYSLAFPEFWSRAWSLAGFLEFLLLAAYVAAVALARRQAWSFLGLWFLLAFSLTSNIIVPIGTIMGERLAYLPAAGFLAFLVAALHCTAGRYKVPLPALYVVSSIAVALLFARSWQRLPVWTNNDTLFARTVQDAPDSPKAAFNYALERYQRHKDLETAEQHFRRAFMLMPTNVESAKFLLNIALERREFGRAEFWCRKVLSLAPDDREVAEKLKQLVALREGRLISGATLL